MHLELNEKYVRDVIDILRNNVVGGGANIPAAFRAALMAQQSESIEQIYGLAQGWQSALASCSAKAPDDAVLADLLKELDELRTLIEQRRKMFYDLDAEAKGVRE